MTSGGNIISAKNMDLENQKKTRKGVKMMQSWVSEAFFWITIIYFPAFAMWVGWLHYDKCSQEKEDL